MRLYSAVDGRVIVFDAAFNSVDIVRPDLVASDIKVAIDDSWGPRCYLKKRQHCL